MFKVYFVLLCIDTCWFPPTTGRFFMVCLYVELNFALDEEMQTFYIFFW